MCIFSRHECFCLLKILQDMYIQGTLNNKYEGNKIIFLEFVRCSISHAFCGGLRNQFEGLALLCIG